MTALVLGANGQDGTYLVRSLLRRGRDVVAAGVEPGPRFADHGRYAAIDLRDGTALARLLAEVKPTEVYHFAAIHKSAGGAPYEDRFGDMLAVNVATVHVVLEQLRRSPGRLLYASSIKAFGEPPPARVDESTPHRSDCLYAVTKNAAYELIAYYRRVHGVPGSVIYFGNHESPLRPAEFFIPKLARALRGEAVSFYTLDFYCDWGSAEEYADICVDVLERAAGEDFVMGTGRCVHARELTEGLGLTNVTTTSTATNERPAPYELDVSKLERLVRRPQRRIEDVVEEIVRSTTRSDLTP
jgi:GDPmannose 4,6-dehydratase